MFIPTTRRSRARQGHWDGTADATRLEVSDGMCEHPDRNAGPYTDVGTACRRNEIDQRLSRNVDLPIAGGLHRSGGRACHSSATDAYGQIQTATSIESACVIEFTCCEALPHHRLALADRVQSWRRLRGLDMPEASKTFLRLPAHRAPVHAARESQLAKDRAAEF